MGHCLWDLKMGPFAQYAVVYSDPRINDFTSNFKVKLKGHNSNFYSFKRMLPHNLNKTLLSHEGYHTLP